MANLFEQEPCILSIQDVKDSLPELSALSDAEIIKFIVEAEGKVKTYLSSIGSCYGCVEDCENIPEKDLLKIQQAILYTIQESYTISIAPVVDNSGVVKSRSEKSCDTEITEEYCVPCDTTDVNVCDDLSCDAQNLLSCFEVNGLSFSLCSGGCFDSDDSCCAELLCTPTNKCKKCLINPL